MISLQDVKDAQARIAPYVVRTPLLRIPALDAPLGCQVYLKFEGFQVMGAFKIRGAMNKALALTPQQRSHGLVCASSGNHAQGVACAAQRLGVRSVIVMPTNANPVKLAGVKSFGGEVELVGTLSSQREARAEELSRVEGMVNIHPYADPYVAAGQGTIGLEIVADLPDAAAVAVPIGGGGLISGVACILLVFSIRSLFQIQQSCWVRCGREFFRHGALLSSEQWKVPDQRPFCRCLSKRLLYRNGQRPWISHSL